MNIKKLENKINTAGEKDVFSHLKKCNAFFIPPLDKSVNISDYSSKIFNKAVLFECWDDNVLVGLVAAYFNDFENKLAYITNVSVLEEYFGNGIASNLIKSCINYGIEKKFCKIILEVGKENFSAISLYNKYNFKKKKNKKDKVILELNISELLNIV